MEILIMDIIAGIFELIGLYVVGCRDKFGFLFNAIGNSLWIGYVFYSQSSYGLLIVCLPAMLINIYNYKKWSKQKPLEIPNHTTKAFWSR